MAERSIIDQLDNAVTELIAQRAPDVASADPTVASLADVARELCGLPRETFKQHLKEDLIGRTEMSSAVQKSASLAVQRVSTYICVSNATAAIDFYREAFGAKELMRLTEPSGKIGHAELQIGEALIKLSDEYPDYGALSPQSIGGSPVRMHLQVENVDEFVQRAIEAGATVTRPIADQFYGDRSGQLADPFGYTWVISTHIKDVSIEEMQKQLEAFAASPEKKSPPLKGRREGFHSVTPYFSVEEPGVLIDFVKEAFGASELFRTTGSAGGMHCEAIIRESMIMIGGGKGIPEHPTAIHLYVPDIDATYQRALDAGATSILAPADQPYGERAAAVKDPTGNYWYIATTFVPLEQVAKDLHTVTVYFHPEKAADMIGFLTAAFGAEELMRSDSKADGILYHAKVRIGDSVVEMGDAHGDSRPLPTCIYLYVENVDGVYEQALKAGAESMAPPTDQPYGDRNASVKDPFDNVWYIATTIGS